MHRSTRKSRSYLLQEAALFLLLSYIFLIGGTFNGLVLYDINFINVFFVTALGSIWIVWRVIGKRSAPATRLDWPIVAFFGAYALSTAFSTDPRRSLMALVQLGCYILVFYLVVDLLRAGWETELFVKTLLLVSGFIIFFGLWEFVRWYAEWFSVGGWSELIPPSTIRIRAFLGHPNFVAAYFISLLPLGVARAVEERRSLNRTLLCFWSVVVLVLIFLTSSRGGWLGTAAALGSLIILFLLDRWQTALTTWRRWRRKPAVIVVLFIIIVIGLLVLVPLLTRQAQHPTHGSGVSARSGIWSVAWASFIKDPISGIGPFTYGTEFIRQYSVPPQMLLAHAHSYPFNIGAETGIIGLTTLLSLTIGIFFLALRRWRSEKPGNRAPLIGLLASLAGLATHSLFDTPQTFPALNIIIAILLAQLAFNDRPPLHRSRQRVGVGLLILCWLLVTGCLWYTMRAYYPHTKGVQASNRGDWATAASELDKGAVLDPQMAFYWLQAGYAHGQLALDDNGILADMDELVLAINAYERGVTLEPTYATNWANLGVLHWAQGEHEKAIADLDQAVELAPLEPAFRLTRGRIHEAVGYLEQAALDYELSLSQRPNWAKAYFFRETPFRRQVKEEWAVSNPNAQFPGGPELVTGWIMLDQNRYQTALELFEESLGLNTPEAYLGLGLSYLGLGKCEQAETLLHKADFIPHRSGWTSVLVKLALGKVNKVCRDYLEAVSYYESALHLLDMTTSLGVGMMGNSDYGWYIFNRESIAADLLPGVEYIIHNDEVVEGMLGLAECYVELSDNKKAAFVYQQVLEVAYDNEIAAERLKGFDESVTP